MEHRSLRKEFIDQRLNRTGPPKSNEYPFNFRLLSSELVLLICEDVYPLFLGDRVDDSATASLALDLQP